MKFHFKGLLQYTGWLNRVTVETDDGGKIIAIRENPESESGTYYYEGFALPGFQNAHSHAFQYAMAGLGENHSGGGDRDFWSWRQAMYRLARSINPDQLENIAAMLYAELLRHGYTNVAEFHYLHHDSNGGHFANRAEMGSRLVSAAKKTGIAITLIPVFYQMGGFDKSPESDQRRFISETIGEYQKLFEESARAAGEYEQANLGIGIHSMRGVEPELIREVAATFPKDVPFHIHISEQIKEVEDCLAHLGKRPVQWMLDNVGLSDRFHFVHATHLDEREINGLVEKGVNVVLCPTTEGNLGDGIFPLRSYQDNGGCWSIGTDSHVSLNPFEELRLLDYGQRLTSHKRNTYFGEADGNSASYAIRQATVAGRKAMNNFRSDYFVIGEPLNTFVMSDEHPLIRTASPENRLNTFMYSSDETMHLGTITSGEWRTKNGRHNSQERISADFVKTLRELGNR